MTTRRALAAYVCLIVLASGCSGSPERQIRFQIFGDAEEIAAYNLLIEAFESKNPGIDIVLSPVPDQKDHLARLATTFAGGKPPDLFLINYRRFGQFAAKGVLEPLGSVLSQTELTRDDLYPTAAEAFRFDGKLVCLPQNISSLVVYYNRKLFREAGVPLPRKGWTRQDFVAAARRLTNNGSYGLSFEPTLVRLAPFVWQEGGEVVDDTENPRGFALSTAEAIEAIRFFTDLRRVHKVVPSQQERKAEGDEARFVGGRLAMLLDSRRLTPSLREIEDLDWDVAPLPSAKREASILHSDAYCMARASKFKKDASRFVTFALGDEGARIIARTGRTVPSSKAISESTAFLDPQQPPDSAQVFLDAIPIMRRLPNTAAWHEIETRADKVIEEHFYSEEPPEFLGIEVDVAVQGLFGTEP